METDLIAQSSESSAIHKINTHQSNLQREIGRYLGLAGLLFSLGFLPLSIQAQGAAPESVELLSEFSLDDLLNAEITTSSRTKESANAVPNSFVVITQDQIKKRGYRNLGEVLLDLPSIGFRNHSHLLAQQSISVRGISGHSPLLILQNGFRVNSPTAEAVPLDDNFSLKHVKQIEVLYGPSSAVYGADAYAGVINMITYSAEEVDSIKATIGVQEGGGFHTSMLGSIKPTDDLSLVFAATFTEQENGDVFQKYSQDYVLSDLVTFSGDLFLPANRRAIPEFDEQSKSFFAKLNAYENFEITLNYKSHEHSTARGEEPNSVFYGAKSRWQTTLFNTNVRYQTNLSDSIESQTLVSYNQYKVNPQSRFNNIFSNFENGYKYSEGTETEISQVVNWNLNTQHKIAAGLTFEWFSSIPKTADLPSPYQTSSSLEEQNLFYPNTDESIPVMIFDVDYENIGGFVQLSSDWGNGFSTVLGARYDDSDQYQSFNPRMGLVYVLSDKVTLKGSYSEAFNAPSPLQLYQHFGSFAFQREDGLYESPYFYLPNESLRPEEVRNTELLLDWRVNQTLNLTFSAYAQRLQDLILGEFSDPPLSDFIPGGVITSTETGANTGSVDINGFDITLNSIENYSWGELSILASYSWLDGDSEQRAFTFSETPLAGTNPTQKVSFVSYTAENKAKLSATFSFGDWTISPKLYWYDESYSFYLDSNGNNRTTPSFFLVNLYADYGVQEKTKLFLRVENLFDEKYYFSTSDAASFTQSPQNPRILEVGISYSF